MLVVLEMYRERLRCCISKAWPRKSSAFLGNSRRALSSRLQRYHSPSPRHDGSRVIKLLISSASGQRYRPETQTICGRLQARLEALARLPQRSNSLRSATSEMRSADPRIKTSSYYTLHSRPGSRPTDDHNEGRAPVEP